MKTKLTTMEKRAASFCAMLQNMDGGEIIVEWRKSRDYGRCPAVMWRGEKIAYASGCGYDKLSAALVEALRPLFPDDTDIFRSCCGAGVSVVRDRLKTKGWGLKHTVDSGTVDAFQLSRVQTEAEKKPVTFHGGYIVADSATHEDALTLSKIIKRPLWWDGKLVQTA